MERGLWIGATGAVLALGISLTAANAGQGSWQASPTPLTTLLMQHDEPVDFVVTAAPQKCLRTSNASFLVVNERKVLFERQGQIFVNDLAKRCPGLRREREDGVPGIGAVNATICSGDRMRLNYDRGSGPTLCQLGDFVPVAPSGKDGASVPPTGAK